MGWEKEAEEFTKEKREDEHFLAQTVDKIGLDYITSKVFGAKLDDAGGK